MVIPKSTVITSKGKCLDMVEKLIKHPAGQSIQSKRKVLNAIKASDILGSSK